MILKSPDKRSAGFTMIEIIITLLIVSVVMTALFRVFQSQQDSYVLQEEIADMQQNLRSALLVMTSDLHMAGYDKMLTNNFGITSIAPRDTANQIDVVNLSANSSVIMTADFDGDGVLDAGETVQFYVYDFINTDTNSDLARFTGSNNQLLAENIVKFGLAFAFDDDLDGELDTYTATNATDPSKINPVIWAYDSDGDEDLDRHLDRNLDGVIDINDSASGSGANEMIVGQALASDVALSRIRAVRIWLLVTTDKDQTGSNQQTTYVVGKYVITPSDQKLRRMISSIVQCRNLML